MPQHEKQHKNVSNFVHRLKTRLALANFKREHGLENVDLRTLESSLVMEKKTQTAHSPIQFKSRKKKSSPRFYPPSDMDRLINKNASHTSVSMPISEQRSTSPKLHAKMDIAAYSSDDEDAAHLLVMMHQSPTMLA
ncbi:hypothetical protein K501DRAFT_277543 [Backusella circina FSU 941]|nr:hypothetical protein K501DRAFT_277543 [Backusella circina FSU 941]